MKPVVAEQVSDPEPPPSAPQIDRRIQRGLKLLGIAGSPGVGDFEHQIHHIPCAYRAVGSPQALLLSLAPILAARRPGAETHITRQTMGTDRSHEQG